MSTALVNEYQALQGWVAESVWPGSLNEMAGSVFNKHLKLVTNKIYENEKIYCCVTPS